MPDDALALFRRCAGCDYSLIGLAPEGQCPECGRVYDGRALVVFGRAREPRVRFFRGPFGEIAGVVAAVCIVVSIIIVAVRTRSMLPLNASAWPPLIFAASFFWSRLNLKRRPHVLVVHPDYFIAMHRVWPSDRVTGARVSAFVLAACYAAPSVLACTLFPNAITAVLVTLTVLGTPVLTRIYYVTARRREIGLTRVERTGELADWLLAGGETWRDVRWCFWNPGQPDGSHIHISRDRADVSHAHQNAAIFAVREPAESIEALAAKVREWIKAAHELSPGFTPSQKSG